MTAIIRNRDFTAPPQARLGLILPGLGHLAVGDRIVGLGLLALMGLLGLGRRVGLSPSR